MARELTHNPFAQAAEEPSAESTVSAKSRAKKRRETDAEKPAAASSPTRHIRVSAGLADRLREASYGQRCSTRELADRLITEGLERLS